MTKHFTTLLQQPTLAKEEIEYLTQIISKYPYFQNARALYLKGLKNTEDYKYNQALKTTAAYTTDRSILFDYITSEAFEQNEISKIIKQNASYLSTIKVDAQDISVKKSVIIDDALKLEIENSKPILDPALFQPIDSIKEIETTQISKKEPETKDNDILKIGTPLDFNKNEKHSFNEWLSLSNVNAIDREEQITPDTTKKKDTSITKAKKFELIDKFMTKNHKLDPVKETTSNHNIANAQMIQPEALMTETLARIYLEQKNYNKAIQSYKILSLKYPEKSGYFADQIKAIKQLQQDNNTQ